MTTSIKVKLRNSKVKHLNMTTELVAKQLSKSYVIVAEMTC